MALPTLQCTFHDFSVVYYVFVSLSTVNNFLYYFFNGHTLRPAINRECFYTMDLLVLFIDAG